MTVTTKLRRSAENLRPSFRWLAAGAFCALTPKCLLCVAAYAGLGTAVGLGGREICGATASGPETWASWLLLAGAVVGFIGFLTKSRPRPERKSA